jgi:hypothetical protein
MKVILKSEFKTVILQNVQGTCEEILDQLRPTLVQMGVKEVIIK